MKNRWLALLAAAGIVLAAYESPTARAQQPDAGAPTFTKDVAPILFKHCATCHRPGEIAPMSLLTYEERAVCQGDREEVATAHAAMACRRAGRHVRQRTGLTDAEKKTLLAWADGGAPKGDPKDLPPAPRSPRVDDRHSPTSSSRCRRTTRFPQGHRRLRVLLRPDELHRGEVGAGRSRCVRATARSCTTCSCCTWRKPDTPRPAGARAQRDRHAPAASRVGDRPPRAPEPGCRAPDRHVRARHESAGLRPAGTAFRLEPGGILELQMHYTTNGKATTDRTKVGLIFRKGAVAA